MSAPQFRAGDKLSASKLQAISDQAFRKQGRGRGFTSGSVDLTAPSGITGGSPTENTAAQGSLLIAIDTIPKAEEFLWSELDSDQKAALTASSTIGDLAGFFGTYDEEDYPILIPGIGPVVTYEIVAAEASPYSVPAVLGFVATQSSNGLSGPYAMNFSGFDVFQGTIVQGKAFVDVWNENETTIYLLDAQACR